MTAASGDWHATKSTHDSLVSYPPTARMEAKTGSFGYDFSGTYSKVMPNELIECAFGDRTGTVEFVIRSDGVICAHQVRRENRTPVKKKRQG